MHRFTLLVGILMIAIGCQDGEENWAGCCGKPPFTAKLGESKIYVPNIFTPNGDLVNDTFMILGKNISEIVSFTVHKRGGKILFQREHIQVNDSDQGWDGKIDGKVIPGQYFVDFTIALPDLSQHTFEAEVCNYPCGIYATLAPIEEVNCAFDHMWLCWENEIDCYGIESSCFE